MKLHKLMSALSLIFLFTACSISDDAPEVPGNSSEDFSNGIFILNEGNFGSGNASISFLDPVSEQISHQIYSTSNEGEALGDVGQNLGFHNEYAFVVLNGSNSIVVVEQKSFKKVAIIENGLKNPRYITFYQDRLFVSNWGDGMNPDDDYVAVFDAETFALEEKIAVSEGPEKLITGQGKIFVAHTGGFGFSNQLSVIDPETPALLTTIEVGDVPNSMVIAGDYLWVLSGGKPSYSGEETTGSLAKINMTSLEKLEHTHFPETGDHPANLRGEAGIFYFTIENKVYRFHPEVNALPQTPVFEMEPVSVLYSFEIRDNRIFAGSASSDFNSKGKLFIYEISGNLLGSFDTGINPNGIFFNY